MHVVKEGPEVVSCFLSVRVYSVVSALTVSQNKAGHKTIIQSVSTSYLLEVP